MKTMPPSYEMSESYGTGALLAVAGGLFDAYSYLLRGHVFANAQTGNIVLFGISLFDGRISDAFFYLAPILAFIAGIFLALCLRTRLTDRPHFHWRHGVLLLEILLVIVVAYLPAPSMDALANVLISFACALQVQAFRTFQGNAFASTMCTGNLRSASECLFAGIAEKDHRKFKKSFQYFGIILCFILGVAVGAGCIQIFGKNTVLFNAALFAAVFFRMMKKKS